MNRNNYKIIDLIILTILSFIVEFAGFYLVSKLGSPIYLSFSFAICIIAMIRWGFLGVITYVISGIALVILKDWDSILHGILFEVVSNAFICIPFLFLTNKNRTVYASDFKKLFVIILLCITTLCLGKSFALPFIDGDITGLDYFGSSLLIFVVNSGVLFLLSKTKSQTLVDMQHYKIEDHQQQED